jgi:hypothetical protein
MAQARTVRDIARRIPANLIFDDTAARDAFFSGVSLTGGEICAIRDGASGLINQTYDPTLPGWRITAPDTWRDEAGTASNPPYTDIARHDADIIVNDIVIGLGGSQVSTNVVVSPDGMSANTTGANNIAIGGSALQTNTEGGSNVAVGSNTLLLNTTGNGNVAIGQNSLLNNQTGNSNIANGSQSLQSNTSGSSNVGIGNGALLNNTTANVNTAIGTTAMLFNTTGNSNVGIGPNALRQNSTTNNNTAVGAEALRNNIGASNTGVGGNVLFNLTTGSNNTAVGRNTAGGITTGSNNTIIGANVTGLDAALTSQVVIANGAAQQVLRATSINTVGLAGVTDPSESIDTSGTARLRATPSNDAGGFSIDRLGLIAPAGEVYSQVNPEGQVKINDGGGVKPNQTGFVANTVYPLAYSGALNYSAFPTTQVPGNLTLTDSNFIDPVNGNILESGILGQATEIRFLVEYTNASNQNSNFAIYVGIANLDNPSSTFTAFENIVKPDGTTGSPLVDFSSVRPGATNPIRLIREIVTVKPIADNLSYPTGYAPCVLCTSTDNTLSFTLDSTVIFYNFKVVR